MDLGVGAVAVATAVAALQLPDVALLVLCLAAAAVQAATIGVVFQVLVVQCMSPLFACGAWLTYASVLLNGNPQWSTVPIGLALLVVVGLWRHDRVVHGGDVAAPEIVGLEFVGIGFLVGSSFAQAVSENVAYALLALTFGLIIAEWGMSEVPDLIRTGPPTRIGVTEWSCIVSSQRGKYSPEFKEAAIREVIDNSRTSPT